jgi:REP element-mobilizing transposase RayT
VAKNILVASIHPAFGELLRLSLEKSRRYSVRLEASCANARDEMGKTSYDLAVLDADVKDSSVQSAITDIARSFPAVPLVLFPPQNNPHHPLIKGVAYKAWIRKPFYLPELLEAVDAVSAGGTWAPGALVAPTTPTNLAWLNEDLEPGSALSNILSQDCLAAVFLTLGGPVVAQAGDLSPAVGEEIIALIDKSWRDDQSTDLVRYTRLEATNADVMVYVTMLEKPLLIALIFSPSMPLMRARAVAVQAVRSLHTRQVVPADEAGSRSELEGDTLTQNTAVWQAEVPPEGESSDGLLLELLASAPSPDPVRAKPKPRENADWLLDENIVPMEEQEFDFPWEVEPSKPADRWDFSTTKPSRPADSQPVPAHTGTTPAKGAGIPAETNQIFTCILIPRQSEQRLEGDLAKALEQALLQVCISSGWKLRNLKINPQAMQFTIEVATSISTGSLVRMLRQQTTQHIAESFSQYDASQGVSDFWAPGFLIASGAKSPAPQLLEDFIRQTRRRQGLAPAE